MLIGVLSQHLYASPTNIYYNVKLATGVIPLCAMVFSWD